MNNAYKDCVFFIFGFLPKAFISIFFSLLKYVIIRARTPVSHFHVADTLPTPPMTQRIFVSPYPENKINMGILIGDISVIKIERLIQ